jgi:hypothetical protein
MESPERSLIIDAVTNPDAPRPYPRLTEGQKQRVLLELGQEYRLNNLHTTS